MREIVAEDEPFVREEYDFDRGLELFADQPYKQEIIRNVSVGRGRRRRRGRGHRRRHGRRLQEPARRRQRRVRRPVPRPARPVDRASSARSSSRRSRARTGAATRSARCSSGSTAPRGRATRRSTEHLHRLEEAERRDHRKLGAELDLFSFPEEIGSGLAVFHPKGGTVRRIMEDYSRQRHSRRGYEFVNSPHITKSNLFEESGHLDWYADGMYPPMELDGGTDYYLKPMNCPFHILIYREPHALVPRPAAAATSSSGRCTATRSRASCTASRACGA